MRVLRQGAGAPLRPAPAVSLVCCVALVFKVTEALVLMTCMYVSGRGGAMHAQTHWVPRGCYSVSFYIFLFTEDHHPDPHPRRAPPKERPADVARTVSSVVTIVN